MTVLDELRRKARGGWLAVVVMGAVVLGAVPFYAGVFAGPTRGEICGGTGCLSSGPDHLSRLAGGEPAALGLYWLVAIPSAYLALAGWFTARARRTGLQQRWGVYVSVGMAVFAILVASVLPAADPVPYAWRALAWPLLTVAVSLAVLGRVERDRRLAVIAAAAAAVAVYVGVFKTHPFVLPDTWPAEPLLSAALSPQGALALLGAAMLACGGAWSAKAR